MNRFNEVMYVVQDSLKYSMFEVALLFVVIVDAWNGDSLHEVTLIVSGMLAVFWTLAAATAEATEEAREMVEEHELFATDFMMSGFILILIATLFLWRGVEWYYTALIALAVGQNLRYTYLSIHWTRERLANERKRDRQNTDNDLP